MITPARSQPAPSPSLASVVIASFNAPVLLLDGDLAVIAASDSFYGAFQIPAADAPGRKLGELGGGEWGTPQLLSALTSTASGNARIDAYELDLKREGRETRKVVINAHKLDFPDGDNVRLLMAVSDVTDARANEKLKDDLLREKAILLQELQHRVANSLQIIASVLLQSAKRVESEETRSHLYDAHSRVMSVASVQKQMAATRLGEVELRPYFTDLCRSIAASMIHDPKQLSLTVDVDASVTAADVSVSLGLIATELVINALKHAYPGHRRGKIVVAYRSSGAEWTLSITDDGIGMPKDAASAKPGLGTSIVEALANQLEAKVQVADANPGTTVSIRHVTSQQPSRTAAV